MPSPTPVSLAARERLRDHQATAAKAVARLRTKGFGDDELVDAGLATRNPDGAVSDFFRERAILTVIDDSGRVVRMLSRDVTDRSAVKYLKQARTHTYDKSVALYRPSTPKLDTYASVVVCEGPLDALAVAAHAAMAGKSAWFAPVAASGRTLSDFQIDRILAIHHPASVFAGDGDRPRRKANLDWAARAAVRGRESVIVDWPDGHDPASWLATHSDDGLRAVTRRGCLVASNSEVRHRHCGAILTAAALDTLPSDGNRTAALARIVDEVGRAAGRLGPKARERYAASAAEVLAPVAVNVAIEAATNGHEVIAVIEHVAVCGAKLPAAGRMIFAGVAGDAIELRDLGAAGWAERRILAAIGAATSAGDGVGGIALDNTISMSTFTGMGLAVLGPRHVRSR